MLYTKSINTLKIKRVLEILMAKYMCAFKSFKFIWNVEKTQKYGFMNNCNK